MSDQARIRQLAEASAWRVRLSEHDLETSDGFEAWLAADPAHADAWDQVQAEWLHVGEQAHAVELLQLRRDALDRASRQKRAHGWGQRWAMAASLIFLLFAGLMGGAYWWHVQPTVYRTAIGERRVITLTDGSKASLDAGSELAVRYSGDARKLELRSGQARFDVAHEAERPFLVEAGGRKVIATGTAFNVDLLGSRLLVTLMEGHVVIVDRRATDAPLVAFRKTPAHAIALDPGQQYVVAPGRPAAVARVNIDRTSAWETGSLVFDNEPLRAVVERVGRYSATPIEVSPAVADLKISGVFKAGDIATFVDVVGHYLPVTIAERDGKMLISGKSSGA